MIVVSFRFLERPKSRLYQGVGYPSGQRGQTVNLLALPSQVRILFLPPLFSAIMTNRTLGPHFFLFTNTSYLEVSVMVAVVAGTNSVSGLNNPELSQMS